MMPDREGEQLGNYRLIRHLGKGGFADVYLGEHIHLETEAAIKVLHTQVGVNEQKQFLKEARIIARLDHPHIVRLLDYGIDKHGIPFLVMAYAPGGTLRERHPDGHQLPFTTILSYVEQIAQALDYIHAQGLMHRDVKPANVLLGGQGTLLLSDFGLASISRATATLSSKGFAGTPAYMAPEQLLEKPCAASDQYALAIIVYEWLAGRRPFQGNQWGLYQQHLHTPPPALHDFVPTIPPPVEMAVLRALSKDPHQRFENVQAFVNALRGATQPRNTLLPVSSSPSPSSIQATSLLHPAAPLQVPGASVPTERQSPWTDPVSAPASTGTTFPPQSQQPTTTAPSAVRRRRPPRPTHLPFFRGPLTGKQLLWLLGYEFLLLILFLVPYRLKDATGVTLPDTFLYSYWWIEALLANPASIYLPGALFGSWRGASITTFFTLASFFSVWFFVPSSHDGIFKSLAFRVFTLLLPVLGALAIGLMYDRRRYRGFWRASGIISIGVAIVVMGNLIALPLFYPVSLSVGSFVIESIVLLTMITITVLVEVTIQTMVDVVKKRYAAKLRVS